MILGKAREGEFDPWAWSRWFALYPVPLEDGRWVWLEMVEWRYDETRPPIYLASGIYWHYLYRLPAG